MTQKKVVALGTSVILLLIAVFTLHTFYYTPTIDRLTLQIDNLQSLTDTKDTQIENLNSQIGNLNSQITNLQSQIDTLTSTGGEEGQLRSTIASLQSQLSNASALIAQLRGPTGIMPTYAELLFVGPGGVQGGDYYLQLSLKNTGNVPIANIFVTLNSQPISMTFSYLNVTISTINPLPPYETATGREKVTTVLGSVNNVPLLIQATASNGTIYTYQTQVTGHI